MRIACSLPSRSRKAHETSNGRRVSMIVPRGPYSAALNVLAPPPSPAASPLPSDAVCAVARNAKRLASTRSISAQLVPQIFMASQ